MKKPKRKRTSKSILLKALSGNLDKMSKSPWVRSLKDGKNLVCPFCQMPIQPCKSKPSAMCEHMILDGTIGREIENALKDHKRATYGKCLVCGRRLSTLHLKKNPTAEICSQCAKKSRKVRIKRVA
jgi:hypothetical protein